MPINRFEKLLAEIKKLPVEEKRSSFLKYCSQNLECVDKKQLSVSEASYNLCAACNLFPEELISEFSELMDLVCDLELPIHIQPTDYKKWQRVQKIIEEKAQKFSS